MKKLLLLTLLTTAITGNLFASDDLLELKLHVMARDVHQKGEAFEQVQFSDSSFSSNHVKLIEITMDKSQCMVSKEIEGVLRCPKKSSALVKISNLDGEVEFDQRVDNVLVMINKNVNSSIASFGNGAIFKTEISEREDILVNIRLNDDNWLNASANRRLSLKQI